MPCPGRAAEAAYWKIRIVDAMQDADAQAISQRLAHLREEHRDLDAAIAALAGTPSPDQIQIQRLKKRKLQLKDQIRLLEDGQLPNIIA
jgi:hypothetical protein